MPDVPALTLDQFALITARLRAGTTRARALEEAEVDTKTWLKAQVFWLGRMASLVANGDNVLHNRYLERLAELEEQAATRLMPLEIEGREPPKARLAPLRVSAESLEGAPPPVHGSPPPVPGSPPPIQGAPPLMAPSPVHAAPMPVHAPPPSHVAPPPHVSAPAQVPQRAHGHDAAPVSVPGAAVPFAADSSPGAVHPSRDQTQAERMRPSLPFGNKPASPEPQVELDDCAPASQTVDYDSPGLDEVSLPFAGNSVAPGPAPESHAHRAQGATTAFSAFTVPNAPSGGDPMGGLNETLGPGVISPLAGKALPFGGAANQASKAASGTADFGTMEEVMPPSTAGAGLPFAGKSAAPPPPAAGDDEEAIDLLGSTLGPDAVNVFAGLALPFGAKKGPVEGASSSTPPPPAAQAGAPALTIEQYASLCATCEVYPKRVIDVYRQYGAETDTARAALDTSWRDKMQRDPATRARFDQLLAEYRGWLQSQRR